MPNARSPERSKLPNTGRKIRMLMDEAHERAKRKAK